VPTKKQIFKLVDKKCYFCPVNEVLDAHRILPGEKGGKYTRQNTVTICPNCHRKCHTGIIKILGRHYTTAGTYIMHWIEDGQEHWG
jgi:hypothetical protein